MDAADLHRALAGRWPQVLAALGVDPQFLTRRHGPCPVCGGRDRYRFDDHQQRGGWYCNSCGAGDGFRLLQLLHGWDFRTARTRVLEAADLAAAAGAAPPAAAPPRRPDPTEPARPTARARALRRTATTPDAVPDVVRYLQSRSLWPLPPRCTLRAHAAAEYWHEGEQLGRYPALLADVVDVNCELVTVHATYLHDGAKLQGAAPRKILSPMVGRIGCAVRLLPLAGDVLGVAEGIETALAASLLHDGLPCWSALNATLFAKFMPPREVRHVVLFADRDAAGLEAAWKLRDELDGRCTVELATPPAPAGDWADVLAARSSAP